MSKLITTNDLQDILNEALPIYTSMSVEDISDKITFTSAWTNMQKKAYLIGGKFIFFSFEGYAGSVVAGTQYTIATIADGYRPKDTVVFTGHTTNGSYLPNGIVNCWTWVGGDITIRLSNSSGNYVFIDGWYDLGQSSTTCSLVDYIVEQGTSGIWTYRKWNSGAMEAWGNSSDSFAMTSGININQYYGSKSYSISALGFTAIHNIQITGGGGGAYFASKVESFDTSTINISARASNTNTTTLSHWFYVKGTWK